MADAADYRAGNKNSAASTASLDIQSVRYNLPAFNSQLVTKDEVKETGIDLTVVIPAPFSFAPIH